MKDDRPNLEQIEEQPFDQGRKHPNAPQRKGVFERLMDFLNNRSLVLGTDRESKHAAGRRRPRNWRAKRKKRRQMAKESRRRNRGRSQRGKR